MAPALFDVGAAENPVDLHTAVGVSMLPVSRVRASAAFKELRQQDPAIALEAVLDAMAIPGVDVRFACETARAAADVALKAAQAAGMEAIPWFDPRYPALLNCTTDPPPVLWARGCLPVLQDPAVAIVGSRAASAYALSVGSRLGGELAHRGVVVASGLARGVDSAAHRGALGARGITVAVLGSGLDRVYPPEHENLSEHIAGTGVVLSELGPGAPPLPENFPLRNRIISGISLAVVVVEASENSGSLITARCAMEQGRDVMAVPGSVLSGRNRGSHSLLKDGAKVVETADDILEELGWPGALNGEGSSKLLSRDPLLAKMEPGEVYGLDALVEATGMAASKLLPRLMELELQGQVVRTAGGKFSRT
jgi:DNA processing protein